MDNLSIDTYVGVVKLVTGEVLISTVECLADFSYRLTDPLLMTTVPVMTPMGIHPQHIAHPWMPQSMDQTFIVAENSVVTISEVRREMFENYVNIINSDSYNSQVLPNNTNQSRIRYEEDNNIPNVVLDKIRSKLDNIYNS
jgi:hypothetical protein